MANSVDSHTANLAESVFDDADTSERLKAVSVMAKSMAAHRDELIAIATEDANNEVREAAIECVVDLESLINLSRKVSKIQDIATLQLHKVLAGVQDSELDAPKRLAALGELGGNDLKQVALLTKCKLTAQEAVSRISDNQDLADLCLFATSIQVRKRAAEKISDPALAQEILSKVQGKDKTVTRIMQTKVTSSPVNIDVPDMAAEAKKDGLVDKVNCKEFAAQGKLIAENLENTNYKATPRLVKLKAEFSEFKSLIDAAVDSSDNADLEAIVKSISALLRELTEKNREFQKQISEHSKNLVAELQKALEDGNTTEANRLWDKIQGNLSNLSGQLKLDIQSLIKEDRVRISELRDWKKFAATEKKKQLIEQMQKILDSNMQPGDRAKRIKVLHKDWKLLGQATQNEALWKSFKKLSDQAYEPCKDHFKQQRSIMSTNFQNRVKLCEQLEEYAATLDASNLRVKELNAMESDLLSEWKKYAPVEQSKVKALQKRFYGKLDELKKIRKAFLSKNLERKKALVASADELLAHDDKAAAMSQAKQLQAEWKTIGPTSYRDDKKYWEAFRAACDKIFSRPQTKDKSEQKAKSGATDSIQAILEKLSNLLQLPESDFVDARRDFAELQGQFQTDIEATNSKQARSIRGRYDKLVRTVEGRFNRLPNKKQSRMLEAVINRATPISECESTLMQCQSDSSLVEAAKNLDATSILSQDSCGDLALDRALEERLRALTHLTSLTQMQKLIAQQEASAHRLIVELEILAELDSPDADSALRMELQLSQLKSNFGRNIDSNEKRAKIRTDELNFHTLGPLNTESRERLQKRLASVITKIS